MNCLITGGSGFIGTHLLRSLLDDPAIEYIYVLDVVPPRVEHPKIQFIECDIRKPITVSLDRRCELCFHLAAACKEPGFEWEEYFRVNHQGTVNVCEFLERTGTTNLVFTSTMMVFRAGEMKMLEDSVTAPDTGYGISKLLAESEVRRWRERCPHRRAKIVRPGVVFGKNENGNFTRMYAALKKGFFAFIGRQNTIKGCVYVKDVVECLKFLMRDPGDEVCFNLVLPEPTTVKYICDAFFDVFQFRRIVPTVPYRLALVLGTAGEILSGFGLKTSIHRRRMQKLYHSTNLSVDKLLGSGFKFNYTLRSALADWKNDCLPQDLH